MKDVLAQPFQGLDHSIWFTGWVLPYNCERSVPNPSIWKESFTWIVPRIRSVRGENLEGWRTGCRPWGVGNDGRIGNLLKKTQCERGDISQRQRRVGRDQDLRTSTLVRHRPIQGESNIDFPGDSEGSLPQPQDSFLDAGEAINDVWSMSGNFRYRHQATLAERRIVPCSTELHWRFQNYTYKLGCYARTPHRRWNIDGSRDFSDSWTGFTQFTLLEEEPPNGYMWSGVRLFRKQLTSRPGHSWPEIWKSMGKHAKLKKKQKWSNEKLHLENERKLRGILFIDLEDKEFKKPLRMPVRSWKHRLLLLCLVKLWKRIVRVVDPTKWKQDLRVSGSWWIYKTAYGRIITKSSWRPFCRKRRQFITASQFGSQIYSCASSYENSCSRKAAVDKEWWKLEKISAWNLTKVRSKKQVIDEARTKGTKVHLASLMDICHL